MFGDELRIEAVSTNGTLHAMTTAAPNTSVTLVLAPLVLLTGTVTLDGVPVTAFDVRLRDTQTEDTHRATGANGKISIAAVTDEHEVIITSAQGYARHTLVSGTAHFDAALTRWGSVRGKVIGDDGKPWVGARILVRDGAEPAVALTDADGAFSLDRIAAGANEIMIMQATAALSFTELHVDLSPGQHLDAGVIDASVPISTLASTSDDLGLRMFVSRSPPTSAQLAELAKDPRAASRAGSDPDAALWIVSVTPTGPAARAGLRADDRVVRVGMSKVAGGKSSVAMMMSLVTPWRSKGRAVTWAVMRNGRELSVDMLVP